jgi:hypothetical protein
MGVYSENRQTGKVPFERMTPAQQAQFKAFQQRGIEARRKKKMSKQMVENAASGLETGLNVGFGGAALAGGVKALRETLPVAAGWGKKMGKFGGGTMNLALGGLMLGTAAASIYDRIKKKKNANKAASAVADKFTARKWAEPV